MPFDTGQSSFDCWLLLSDTCVRCALMNRLTPFPSERNAAHTGVKIAYELLRRTSNVGDRGLAFIRLTWPGLAGFPRAELTRVTAMKQGRIMAGPRA